MKQQFLTTKLVEVEEMTRKEILLNRLYDKIWFGLDFALGMTNKKGEVE